MPVGSPAVILSRQYAAPGVAPVSAAETAILTTPALAAGQPSGGALGESVVAPGPVRITGVLVLTVGASTTSVNIRLRQGAGTGGALVLFMPFTLTGGNSANIPFSVEDLTGYLENPGGQYTVTVQQSAGTTNGTMNAAEMEVSV